jgi:hypothetical protein
MIVPVDSGACELIKHVQAVIFKLLKLALCTIVCNETNRPRSYL